jgi:hypothetical protein
MLVVPNPPLYGGTPAFQKVGNQVKKHPIFL